MCAVLHRFNLGLHAFPIYLGLLTFPWHLYVLLLLRHVIQRYFARGRTPLHAMLHGCAYAVHKNRMFFRLRLSFPVFPSQSDAPERARLQFALARECRVGECSSPKWSARLLCHRCEGTTNCVR